MNQKDSEQSTPDLTKIRRALFWDTDFDKIDWQRNKSAVIKRIFERGNDEEIEEIIAFYGRPTIELIIDAKKQWENDLIIRKIELAEKSGFSTKNKEKLVKEGNSNQEL